LGFRQFGCGGGFGSLLRTSVAIIVSIILSNQLDYKLALPPFEFGLIILLSPQVHM
jgi:hypothetical protein